MDEYKFTSDIVIGLEIHTELNTKTKLFCSCSREEKEGEEPNSRTCPTCLGMPGSKPVLNKKAVEYALKLCSALKCKISPELIFSRKSYFYPDMAKNYQISQYEIPLGNGGELRLTTGRAVKLKRVHMEEDPASLVHLGDMKTSPFVLVDYNRSGNPLCEIVTEPDMTSADEARDFMKQLITVLEYLGIFDINKCIIKADANISIKDSGYTRAEIKNITGFKEIERALNYEILRQKNDVKEGKKILNETRGWDAENGLTYSMRTKESEEDYGYIIDPDLVITKITDEWLKQIKKEMPELAEEKLKKFLEEHKIEETTANVLAKDKKLADIYESVIKEVNPDLAAKWIRRELPRVLNYNKKTLEESGILPEHMIALLKLIQDGKITEKIGQRLIEKLAESPYDINEYVQKEGLIAVSDSAEIDKFVKEGSKESIKALKEYFSGNERSFDFVFGNVMKKSNGKIKPNLLKEILRKNLDFESVILKKLAPYIFLEQERYNNYVPDFVLRINTSKIFVETKLIEFEDENSNQLDNKYLINSLLRKILYAIKNFAVFTIDYPLLLFIYLDDYDFSLISSIETRVTQEIKDAPNSKMISSFVLCNSSPNNILRCRLIKNEFAKKIIDEDILNIIEKCLNVN